jgi:hypothetical protein
MLAVLRNGDLAWPANPVHLIERVIDQLFENEPANLLPNDAGTLREI